MWLAKLLLLIYGNRIRDTVLYMWVWFGEKAKKALSVQTNHMVSTIPFANNSSTIPTIALLFINSY
jgi:hypothetical protein